MNRTTIAKIAALAALILVGIITVPPRAVVASDQGAEPGAGAPGTTFAFFATGFDDTESVGYWFNDPDGNLHANDHAYVVNAWRGRADWSWESPADAKPGFWSAVATGKSSGVERVIVFEIRGTNAAQTSPVVQPVAPPSNQGSVVGQNVAPTQGPPGTEFSFFATGFNSTEHVAYWFNDPSGHSRGKDGYVVRAWQGRADWRWRVPNDVVPGIWTAVAQGMDSKVNKVILFEVLAPGQSATGSNPAAPAAGVPSNPSDVAVAPVSGPPGTGFSFFATGYPSGERVRYWATDPTGYYYDSSKYSVVANTEGRADWTWTSPNDAKQGVWTMTVHGTESNIEKVIRFEVRDPNAPAPVTGPSPSQMAGLNNPSDVGVDPVMGYPDTKISFFASGFPAKETVRYWAIDPNGGSDEAKDHKITANDDGRADWEWKVPSGATPGLWTMVAFGRENKLEKRIQFLVGDPNLPEGSNLPVIVPIAEPVANPADVPSVPTGERPPNPPNTGLEPSVGVPDSTFAFFVAELPAHETILYWVIDPNGVTYEDDKNYRAHANDDGRADWTWKAPDGAAPGIWTMVAWGKENKIETRIYFEITRPATQP